MKIAQILCSLPLMFSLLDVAQASSVAEDLLDNLVSAEFTGGCFALKRMLDFQNETKIEGGYTLATRFLRAESFRYKMPPKKYLAECVHFGQNWAKTILDLKEIVEADKEGEND